MVKRESIAQTVLLSILVLSAVSGLTGQTPQSKTATDYFSAGVALQQAGQPEQALEQYKSALRLDPKHFGAQANSGICYLVLKKFESAIGAFRTADGLKPHDPHVQFYLGEACAGAGRSLEAIDAFKEAIRLDPKMTEAYRALATFYGDKGDYDEAVRLMIQATQIRDHDPALLFDLALMHLIAGNSLAAVEVLRQVLLLKPDFPQARLNLGLAYERLGQFTEAAAAFTEAAALDPRDATPNFNLGIVFQKLGKHAEAIEAFKRAIDSKPDWAEAYRWLGESYHALGDHDGELTAFKEAVRYGPNDVGGFYALGHAYVSLSRFEEAIEPLKQVVRLRPQDPESHYALGNTYMMARKFDEAIASLNRAIELKPDFTLARERLQVASARKNLTPDLDEWKQQVAKDPKSAQAHADLCHGYNASGMFSEAEQECQTAIALDPGNADYYNRLAINYVEWGKPEKAVEPYKQAASIKPHHVLYFSLGNTYQALGRLDDAEQAYKKSLEIKPTFTHSMYQLGMLYAKQGRHQEAIELFRQVLQSDATDVYANHALGIEYAVTGNKAAALQQYDILKRLNPAVAASLLSAIPK